MSDPFELYQELILDHYKSPRNRRKLEGPDCEAKGYNPLCGDSVSVFLKLENDVITEITFEGSGCAISTASASLMTESLKGKTLADAKALFKEFHGLVTDEPVETGASPGLGKLEVFSGVCRYPARVKCATLAWHTVNEALKNGNTKVSTE